jgi:hypothetical protein
MLSNGGENEEEDDHPSEISSGILMGKEFFHINYSSHIFDDLNQG